MCVNLMHGDWGSQPCVSGKGLWGVFINFIGKNWFGPIGSQSLDVDTRTNCGKT